MTLFLLVLTALASYYFFIYKDRNRFSFFAGNDKRCPSCNNVVEKSFNVCPICKETLKRKCVSCGETIDAAWVFCPYCENSVGKSE
ncbi:MAG: hypothetical protein CVU84_10230 [Firmicutes bacterium HGW-Firmicutes-1]|jgi:RNA polymerase subunit RPABC4/transcription elongation factor Spt4|nr:MAG: hypothetical protein CVU84_10230 [Firmicutes bacterium HGW-Firmicutes-1]